MPFQIHPIKEFLVRPALPASISRLNEIAYNLIWAWEHTFRSLFNRLDPALRQASNHHPVVLLGRIPQSALEGAGADPRYLALYRRACAQYDTYMSGGGA